MKFEDIKTEAMKLNPAQETTIVVEGQLNGEFVHKVADLIRDLSFEEGRTFNYSLNRSPSGVKITIIRLE